MNRRLFFDSAAVVATFCILLLAVPTADAARSTDEKRLSFTAPAAPWSLTLPAANFQVAQQEIKPDGSGAYFFLRDKQSHLNVSLFIEPASKCRDSKACRDMVRNAGNPMWENPKNLVSSQMGNVSYFEFLVPSLRGLPLQQQSMYAEFVVDGFWVDLHISKALYKPEDHVLFEELVKAVKFEPKEEKAKSQGEL